jgi:hypothetical protein
VQVNSVNSLLPYVDPRVVRPVAAAVFVAVLLTTSGAFDTEAAQFGPRLSYWLAIAAVSTLMLQWLHRLLRKSFDAVPDLWLRAFGWAILTLPLNMIASLGCKLLYGGPPSLGGFLLLLPGMAMIVATLQFTLLSFRPAGGKAGLGTGESCAGQVTAPAGGLSKFLPLPLQNSKIWALNAEDHYVRVHTEHGQTLLRMRMTDAVAMLEGKDGVRPHRSWWVSRPAVRSLRTEGGRTFMRLLDGTDVPVSRGARRDLGPLFKE